VKQRDKVNEIEFIVILIINWNIQFVEIRNHRQFNRKVLESGQLGTNSFLKVSHSNYYLRFEVDK
jgi:hypothetical protein